jgi:hypothetical protein
MVDDEGLWKFDQPKWYEAMAEALQHLSSAAAPSLHKEPRPEGCICSEAYGVGPEQCGKHGAAALHKEGAGGVSPKALKAALDEIESENCVCGAKTEHRTMHNWAYCSLHARLDKVWKLFVDAQDSAASPAGRAEQEHAFGLRCSEYAKKLGFEVGDGDWQDISEIVVGLLRARHGTEMDKLRRISQAVKLQSQNDLPGLQQFYDYVKGVVEQGSR